jgi:hypothetical protein
MLATTKLTNWLFRLGSTYDNWVSACAMIYNVLWRLGHDLQETELYYFSESGQTSCLPCKIVILDVGVLFSV